MTPKHGWLSSRGSCAFLPFWLHWQLGHLDEQFCKSPAGRETCWHCRAAPRTAWKTGGQRQLLCCGAVLGLCAAASCFHCLRGSPRAGVPFRNKQSLPETRDRVLREPPGSPNLAPGSFSQPSLPAARALVCELCLAFRWSRSLAVAAGRGRVSRQPWGSECR